MIGPVLLSFPRCHPRSAGQDGAPAPSPVCAGGLENTERVQQQGGSGRPIRRPHFSREGPLPRDRAQARVVTFHLASQIKSRRHQPVSYLFNSSPQTRSSHSRSSRQSSAHLPSHLTSHHITSPHLTSPHLTSHHIASHRSGPSPPLSAPSGPGSRYTLCPRLSWARPRPHARSRPSSSCTASRGY